MNSNYQIRLLISLTLNLGSVSFLLGSICYLPTLQYLTLGALLFVLGSLSFFISHLLMPLLDSRLGFLFFFHNAASFIITLGTISNCLFIVGSIFFLPQISPLVGAYIFTLGLILLCIASGMIIYGRDSKEEYFSGPFEKIKRMKQQFIRVSILTITGSFLFIEGIGIMFNPLLQRQAAICFIMGSIFFILESIYECKIKFLNPNYYRQSPILEPLLC